VIVNNGFSAGERIDVVLAGDVPGGAWVMPPSQAGMLPSALAGLLAAERRQAGAEAALLGRAERQAGEKRASEAATKGREDP
jgi:hypothetical protein